MLVYYMLGYLCILPLRLVYYILGFACILVYIYVPSG